MHNGFYLLVEDTSYSCFLVSRFLERFGQSGRFRGVFAAEPMPSAGILQDRERFHAAFAGKTGWSDAIRTEWLRLYQPLDATGHRMVEAYGLPRFAMSHHHNTVFLGTDVNGREAQDRVSELCRRNEPWLVNYLPKLLKPWWLEVAGSRLLNCHSAVLPHARGMYAVEQIAASRDIDAFRRAAGVTVHFIDEGIDTGPIVRAERLVAPFRFASLWELKAHLYRTGIETYASTVGGIVEAPDTVPAGVYPCADLMGRNYQKKHFTEDKKRQAVRGYLWMKSQVSLSN
jgi:phosphoribosylglycinamide formyltransferase-1